ncbi:hypothetical protein ACFWOB_21925 [Streptomyces sp. NPDC058420]|uniref:hypothetical protein n=1 Tax=Streptomyces sp. NPDC058420 TaxID=3346489 RepID=UPI0036588F9C
MNNDEIGARELYDLVLTAAERLTHPAYTGSLKNVASWRTAATGLARLVKNLDAALIEGGDIPMEWVIGGLTDDIPNDDGDTQDE